MLFNSWIFIGVFLPVTLIVFRLLVPLTSGPRLPMLWLTLASIFFYGWWNPLHVPLLLASVLVNHAVGRRISPSSGGAPGNRRALMFAGVTANLLLLGYFKYSVFVMGNVGALAGIDFGLRAIVLPLGISFFTFQQVAYLVDATEGRSADYGLIDYCLFVTFFPQLIAGPIVHHKDLMPQFAKPENLRFSHEGLALGLAFFTMGLWKKVVLADQLATYATPVFSAATTQALTASEAWTGALTYSMQLYFDFSGYSDMAIGLGLLFGIKLPFNFNSPYQATDIIDFWRRWHITLSEFLRDYLYIRLGGNRKGKTRRYVNLFLTMLLGGIWHGAGWTFVIWGALHGMFLIVNHAWRAVRAKLGMTGEGGVWAARAVTFLCVTVAWVFFRATSLDEAFAMLHAMTGANGWTTGEVSLQSPADIFQYRHEILIAALLGVCMLAPNSQTWLLGMAEVGRGVGRGWRLTPARAGVAACCFLFTLTRLSAVSEFIYFNF
ncbi:hypothetical protein N825_25630 [Skermanella stibiiresistens SB22]|uniref:Probable alginate O-acetylase AlgI n=1 Tax=Skermanella stibiiresistens SB22 TaxID=1385369 RepID=W9GS49_9PROT|nr:MBOAT family protein [Skermanella stibiiresistens]EWY36705.1 hypothetical protein N825_25630 [Skermanella stibiiresistens SB22]